MNDPSKRIDVNISSLLSLKAELLRKEEEVAKTKAQQATNIFIPRKKVNSTTEKKTSKSKKSDNIELNTSGEDASLLIKSRKVLEAKSCFYEQMRASGGTLMPDNNSLIMFDLKKQIEDSAQNKTNTYKSNSSTSSNDDSNNETDNQNDEDWVEYTDCLGRTRKCLKKDLEFFKKKDNQLAENIQPRINLNSPPPKDTISSSNNSTDINLLLEDKDDDTTSTVSKYDQMKMNWERKEEENTSKENVHYQDVFFNEARQHGVGYYAFSTDEEEREKQMKDFNKLREKTIIEQQHRESQRLQRQNIIAERVKAAKNRQRIRQGLPPLDDKSDLQKSEKLLETNEVSQPDKKDEERKIQEKERLQEEERKRHIRPWDVDKYKSEFHSSNLVKDDHDKIWKFKPEKEPMSQAQWNEIKRNERNFEYAPILRNSSQLHNTSQAIHLTSLNEDKNSSSNTTSYFTTKKLDSLNKQKYMNTRKRSIPSSSESDEYCETYVTKLSKQQESKSDLEESIEAGLRFIRDKSDKGSYSVKSSWSANASNTDN